MRGNIEIENTLLTCNNLEDASDDGTYDFLSRFLVYDTGCGMERMEVKMINERDND
jgi:hypothetical protein